MTVLASSCFSFDYDLLTEHLRAETSCNLTITCGWESFRVHAGLAASLSSAIFQALLEDPLLRQFPIREEPKGPMSLIKSLLQGEKVTVDASNWQFLLARAVELGHDVLINDIFKSDVPLDSNFVCDLSVSAFTGNCDAKPFALFLARHFAECREKIRTFPVAFIDMILETGECKAPYLDIIEPYVNENPRHRLAKHYPFSVKELRGDLDVNLNMFRSKLASVLPLKRVCDEGIPVEMDKDPFDGVTRSFVRPVLTTGDGKTDQNMYFMLSSVKDAWDSGDGTGNVVIVMDFGKSAKLSLKRYSIRFADPNVHDLSVFVSDDKKLWSEVDRRIDLESVIRWTNPLVCDVKVVRNGKQFVKFEFAQKRVSIARLEVFGTLKLNI